MTPEGRLLATLPGLVGDWPGATPADWSRAAADGLEAALRLTDATERYVRGLSQALGGRAEAGVAVVAGARGALSRALRAQLGASGLRVLAVDTPAPAATVPPLGRGDVDGVLLDIRDPDACRDATAEIERRHGRIGVLVHVLEPDSAPRGDVETRLDGVYHLCKCVVDGMSGRGFGRIVVVCLAPETGDSGAAYRAAKTSLLAFSRSLAKEVAARGITVNVVSPGPIDEAEPQPTPASAVLLERIPARRLAAPADVASVVGFLVGAGAGYVTGADIPVSGGLRL